MMKKITAPPVLRSISFAIGAAAEAQQPGKFLRIGFLDTGTASGSAVLAEAFRQDMSKLGWIEGKISPLSTGLPRQRSERLAELAAELVRLKVDVIVVVRDASRAAKQATVTIPIVMATSADPVALSLVANLARPGGNVTGLSTLSPELNTKRLEILKDVVPGSREWVFRGGRQPA